MEASLGDAAAETFADATGRASGLPLLEKSLADTLDLAGTLGDVAEALGVPVTSGGTTADDLAEALAAAGLSGRVVASSDAGRLVLTNDDVAEGALAIGTLIVAGDTPAALGRPDEAVTLALTLGSDAGAQTQHLEIAVANPGDGRPFTADNLGPADLVADLNASLAALDAVEDPGETEPDPLPDATTSFRRLGDDLAFFLDAAGRINLGVSEPTISSIEIAGDAGTDLGLATGSAVVAPTTLGFDPDVATPGLSFDSVPELLLGLGVAPDDFVHDPHAGSVEFPFLLDERFADEAKLELDGFDLFGGPADDIVVDELPTVSLEAGAAIVATLGFDFSDLFGSFDATRPLADLNAGSGVPRLLAATASSPITERFLIEDEVIRPDFNEGADDERTAFIAVSADDTSGNLVVVDLVDDLNDAIADAGVEGARATLSEAGLVTITIVGTQYRTLTHSCGEGFGFPGGDVSGGAADLVFTFDTAFAGEVEVPVDLSQATTIGDVVTAFEGTGVTVELDDANDRLRLSSADPFRTTANAVAGRVSPAAFSLGIGTIADDFLPLGDDGFARLGGRSLSGRGLYNRLYVLADGDDQPGTLSAEVRAFSPAGGLDVAATLGFLAVGLDNEGDDFDLSISRELRLVDPGEEPDGRITLAELLDAGSDAVEEEGDPLVAGSATFNLTGELGGDLTDGTDLQPLSGTLGTVTITVDSDDSRFVIVDASSVDADVDFHALLRQLAGFDWLDLAEAASDFLDGLVEGDELPGILGDALPFLNEGLSGPLADFAGILADVIDQALAADTSDEKVRAVAQAGLDAVANLPDAAFFSAIRPRVDAASATAAVGATDATVVLKPLITDAGLRYTIEADFDRVLNGTKGGAVVSFTSEQDFREDTIGVGGLSTTVTDIARTALRHDAGSGQWFAAPIGWAGGALRLLQATTTDFDPTGSWRSVSTPPGTGADVPAAAARPVLAVGEIGVAILLETEPTSGPARDTLVRQDKSLQTTDTVYVDNLLVDTLINFVEVSGSR